jgi:hypothetical protein
MQTQYFFERQSISQFFIFSAGAELLRVVQLESMPGYEYPNIDSGATPIGSAGRAPDRKTNLRKNSIRKEEEENWSAGRAPDEELREDKK